MEELKLFWRDKNWENRGCARHRKLVVDYEAKTYDYSSTYWEPHTYGAGFIEVVRLSDLKNFVENLKEDDFKQK